MLPPNNLSTEQWKLKRPICISTVRTRLLYGDVELSNAIEYASWDSDPVVPVVCTKCWQAYCGRHGISHVDDDGSPEFVAFSTEDRPRLVIAGQYVLR